MDRAAIVRDNTYGTGTLAVADLAPYYWAFDPRCVRRPTIPPRLSSCSMRPGGTQVPTACAFATGRVCRCCWSTGPQSQTVRTITAQVQQMYRALGVDLQLKGFDYATLYAAAQSGGILNGGKFDLAMYAWVSGSDPDDSSQWTCAMIPPAGNNIARYCSPAMEAAQRLALSTFDRADAQARIFAHRIAAAERRARRLYLRSVAALRPLGRLAVFHAERHQRGVERPGLAPVDRVPKAAASPTLGERIDHDHLHGKEDPRDRRVWRRHRSRDYDCDAAHSRGGRRPARPGANRDRRVRL